MCANGSLTTKLNLLAVFTIVVQKYHVHHACHHKIMDSHFHDQIKKGVVFAVLLLVLLLVGSRLVDLKFNVLLLPSVPYCSLKLWLQLCEM